MCTLLFEIRILLSFFKRKISSKTRVECPNESLYSHPYVFTSSSSTPSTPLYCTHKVLSLSLSHHISRISYFISLFFSCYSTCAGMLLLLRNFRLKVVIWVTQSTRGRENMCPLLGTVRYAFLQDSFGCFLDLMVAENPPFWRYIMFISCYIFRAWFFFFPPYLSGSIRSIKFFLFYIFYRVCEYDLLFFWIM